MKRLLTLFIALAILMFSAVGCGKSDNDSSSTSSTSSSSQSSSESSKQTAEADKTETAKIDKPVTLWMKKQHVDKMNTMMEEKAEEISKKLGNDITLEIIAYEDFPQKWAAGIESGAVPDISFMTYAEVGIYHEDGLLMDVSDVVKELQEQNGNMYQNLMDPITFDGKQYMIPMWTESQILYYRTDVIDSPPKTWEEFREIAKKVTDPSKGFYGAGIGFGKGNSDAEWLTRAMLWAHGAYLVDENGKAAINSAEAKQVAQMIYEMYTVDKSIPPSASNWDDSGNNQAYISGQVAMIFNTGSVINVLKNEHPDLYEKTALASFPAGPNGQFVPGIDDGLVIFKNAQNPEGAKLVVKELMEIEWYSKWLEEGAPLCLPIYEEVGKTGIWTEPKVNKPFVDQIPAFKFIGLPQKYNSKAGEVYNLRIVNDTFQKILSGSDTIDAALQWAEQEINKVYSK